MRGSIHARGKAGKPQPQQAQDRENPTNNKGGRSIPSAPATSQYHPRTRQHSALPRQGKRNRY